MISNEFFTAEYFVYECDDIEIFADRTVYVAFYEGLAPSSEKFMLNGDGSIEFNESYSILGSDSFPVSTSFAIVRVFSTSSMSVARFAIRNFISPL